MSLRSQTHNRVAMRVHVSLRGRHNLYRDEDNPSSQQGTIRPLTNFMFRRVR